MSIATEIQRLQTAKADIKSAIENKGVTVGDGTIDTYAAKIDEISGGDYDQGYEDGKNSVVDLGKLCAVIQVESLNVFEGKEITLNLDNVTTLKSFCYTGILNNTVESLTINCPNLVTSCAGMIRCAGQDPYLKRLTLNVNTSQSDSFLDMVRYQTGLEVIDGNPLNFSSSTNNGNAFYQNFALKEVRFASNSIYKNISFSYCSYLSSETIQSIIDGLADLTGGTAQTLTLHATVGAKLTDEQKAAITAKNWTLVY